MLVFMRRYDFWVEVLFARKCAKEHTDSLDVVLLEDVQCTVYSVQCTVCSVQCTVYGVQGTQNLTLKGSEEHLFTNNQDSINIIFIVETQKPQPGVCGVKSR